jgi:serine/threonine protein kinase/tetratricopeptide (TPR) repeat protein
MKPLTEREIFLEALEMPTPESRAIYLQTACGGDVVLRRNVEELLKEHSSNDSLLAGSALEGERASEARPAALEAPAQTIGRYKLLEKIGEGGFGEVWMAEQREPVKRRVALKIIKLGMDSRQVVARFEAERQALAMMDHPNIAKIFDAGTTECPLTPALSRTGGAGVRRTGEGVLGAGRPYFVMELVRGIKITDYCDQNQLPTRDRLDLFILVCQALQHAHQKGIIHRDIKPSNILVTLHDGVPVPKVIDFGIAKATQGELTDKTVFTQFQQFIGTPAYISPEQAEMGGLDIDTRADIYSLGVLLYELLVGQTPFDAKEMMQGGLDALRQIIREKEPLRPSTRLNTLQGDARTAASKRRQTDVGKLVHQLQGDLDWIAMKCLEKDRTRRYETANSLAADIRHYLSDEPVVACPPSAGYRLRKFVRRNKGPVLAAGSVLLTLVVGIIGTTMGRQAAHEHERVLNERARQAIEMVASETAIEHLTREKELSPEQREFLSKMIQYYAESAQDRGTGEEERRRQAQAYHRMGNMNRILGRSQDSEKAYRRAVALGQQLAADFPNQPEYRLELAHSHNGLGVLLLRANGRPTEGESAYVEALAILKQLAADFPARRDFRQALAGIQNNLGNLLLETGRQAEAELVQAEALAIRKQLAADFPTDPILRRALAQSHNNLGWLFHSTKRLKEAEAAYRDALALLRQVVAGFPNRPEFTLELATSHNNLGSVLRDTGRPKEAEVALAEALAMYKQLVADFPNRPEFRRELADAEAQRPRSASGARGQSGRGAGDRVEKESTSGDLGISDFPKK